MGGTSRAPRPRIPGNRQARWSLCRRRCGMRRSPLGACGVYVPQCALRIQSSSNIRPAVCAQGSDAECCITCLRHERRNYDDGLPGPRRPQSAMPREVMVALVCHIPSFLTKLSRSDSRPGRMRCFGGSCFRAQGAEASSRAHRKRPVCCA